MLRSANLAVKFALELAALAGLGYWGATRTSGVEALALALGTPLAAGLLWARFAAPMSPRRLPLRLRIPFELGVFAAAALAWLTVSTAGALVFTSVVILNSLLLTVLRQWDSDSRPRLP